MNKNRILVLGCCLIVLVFGTVSLAAAAEAEPKVGQVVANPQFAATITPEGSTYLGLAKQGPFTLKDIKASYVLVEQFNTNCPHCMHQAPIMNQLFDKVQADPQLKDKVKFIGTGQGNEETQLKMWKAFNKINFALVPDPNQTFGKALNFTPYPVTVLLDKTGKILFVHIGSFDNADEVLAKIKAIAK